MPPPEEEMLQGIAVFLKLLEKHPRRAITLAQKLLQLDVILNVHDQKYTDQESDGTRDNKKNTQEILNHKIEFMENLLPAIHTSKLYHSTTNVREKKP
jgi:hypothetical protein